MTDPSTLKDAPARRRALDPQRSFIVQAPAGSGKTELLTQRYLQLLTTVEQPEQILAITFTRKAASEMRNRILQSLLRARTTPRPETAHEQQNWQLAQAALQRDQERAWQLEAHPSRLRIQTIDALNSSLSRRLPVLAGMGANMEIAQDSRAIYEAVCERLLKSLGDGSKTAQHVETLLRHLANRVPDFVEMLCDLLACRDHWLPLIVQHQENAGLRDSIEHTLHAVIEHHLQWLHHLLPADAHAELLELAAFAAGNLLKEGDARDGLSDVAELHSLPGTSCEALPTWLTLASLMCKKDGAQLKPELYLSLDKRHGFPADKQAKPYKDRMKALLADLSAVPELADVLAGLSSLPSPRFSEVQWQVLESLLRVLPDAVAELMLEFQARAQVDYVEMSQRALRAMGTVDEPTDAALALDAQLQHILIDEFQDTSTTQMTLLRLLTAGWSEGHDENQSRTLFCVGDPMQSIYRFRQAEVGLFLEMQKRGLPHVPVEPLQLQTNFRSTQPIVNWVNAQFPHIMPAEDDAELGAVHYSPSEARPSAASSGRVVLHAAVNRSVEREASEICEQIRRSRSENPEQSIAILVAGRSHVSAVAQTLKSAGIAFNAVEIERLQHRSVIQDLLALTRALLHLGDRTAWLACLRAPWCGLTLIDLHALVGGDERGTIFDLLCAALQGCGLDESSPCNNSADARFIEPVLTPSLNSLSADARQRLQGFANVITAALAERGRHALRDWVERTWLALHGPACLHNANELDDAQSYFARLDELEVAGDLADVARLESELDELYASGGDRDGTGAVKPVEIMTIHKSKGLEFDVVILPSLHRKGGKDSTRLLRWTQITGLDADGLVLAPPAARGADGDAIYQWLADLEKRRARYERQRLFYVAVTRARRELHLFGSAKLQKDGVTPSAPPSGTLLSLLWPMVQGEFSAAVTGQMATAGESARVRDYRIRRLPLEWRPPTPVPALQGHSLNQIANTETAIEFEWVGEVARHVGTVVHAELETLVKLAPESMRKWNATQRRAALTLHLAELGVPESLRERAVARVIEAVEYTLRDARGRWILGLDAAHQDAGSEIALSGMINSTVVSSVIDRSFIDADGTRWIIDFKTSSHEGGGREAFLQSELQRYGNQMQRYARLMSLWKPQQRIRCALYFPLMGEWREVGILE